MNKVYVVFNDGRVGYVKYICNCSECKTRGIDEIFINDLNDNYLDCIKTNCVKNIIYLGESLQEGVSELSKYYQGKIDRLKNEKRYLQGIINLLNKQ